MIEVLFDQVWDAENKRLKRNIVTLEEVKKAIITCNEKYDLGLSEKNPANFLKDIVRGKTASAMWPETLKENRITARQLPGEGNAFEFLTFPEGTNVPFPNKFEPVDATPRYKLQSVSMPMASRMLGRADETWLTQCAVNLRLVETYFATCSDLPVVELSHLQMGIKLRNTEIDALFLASCIDKGTSFQCAITCEAKQHRERILEHQIINQAISAFAETHVDMVAPIALRSVKDIGIQLIEFERFVRDDLERLNQLLEIECVGTVIYELCPPVQGI